MCKRVGLLVVCGAALVAVLLAVGGCATRPVNPPIASVDPAAGYRYENRDRFLGDEENIVILAFSGGGTRAAAFSYGVLEALRDIEVTMLAASQARRQRFLDLVTIVTGVSGGSFTALAYGLYGDRLFGEYEQRFLKRDVEGELIGRLVDPLQWGALASPEWGRSELAAAFYDDVLFDGATYADLQRRPGPLIVATATDISTGARFYFTQSMFDLMCSDLGAVPLSRAAAASSSVPVVFSPVTLNNYGGRCGYREPPLLKLATQPDRLPQTAARATQQLKELRTFEDGEARPYVHLVDGGVSDNLGLRGILDIVEELDTARLLGLKTPLDRIRRIAVFVVNALSEPKLDWDQRPTAPGTLDLLLRSTGLPIDHYSYEAIDQLRAISARWKLLRRIRDAAGAQGNVVALWPEVERVPEIDLHVIDVSFPMLANADERAYLNDLPTTLVLPDEAVDRLRAAARAILKDSPDFRVYLEALGSPHPEPVHKTR